MRAYSLRSFSAFLVAGFRWAVLIVTFASKVLNALWSGGIDTTAVIVALREALRKHPTRVAQNVFVCYCKSSLEEYPWFYRNYILKGPWKRKMIPQHVRDILSGIESTF